MLNLQYAISEGAGYTCAVDVNRFKLDFAERFGAGQTYLASDENISDKIKKDADALMDLVIVCTGAHSAVDLAFSIVEKGGTILILPHLIPGTN